MQVKRGASGQCPDTASSRPCFSWARFSKQLEGTTRRTRRTAPRGQHPPAAPAGCYAPPSGGDPSSGHAPNSNVSSTARRSSLQKASGTKHKIHAAHPHARTWSVAPHCLRGTYSPASHARMTTGAISQYRVQTPPESRKPVAVSVFKTGLSRRAAPSSSSWPACRCKTLFHPRSL